MSTRRSLAYSFLDHYASLAVAVVSIMVLARLLTPEEVGVFSVTMALLALVNTVRQMGAGQYLVQEKDLTVDRIRAVWTVQLGLGVLLGSLVMLGSTPLAVFYDEPRVRDVMMVLALNYVISPVGSITHAWLMREMRYDALAIINFTSTLAGAVVSVWLAGRGHGAISLAWGSLCATAVSSGTSILFRPSGYPWLPGWREVPRVLSFGANITSSSVVETIATSAPEFLIGKFQSLAAAGLFSRANGLVAMFDRLVTDSVRTVALSLFSSESRASRDIAPSFLTAIAYITALSWTFASDLVLLAHPLVRVLYGPQWDASVDLTRLLAAAMAVSSVIPMCSVALVGVGAISKVLKTTLVSAAVTFVMVLGASPLGLLWVGAALLAASFVSCVFWLIATQSVVTFSSRDLLTTLARSAVVTLGASIGPIVSALMFGLYPDRQALPLVVGLLGSAGGFIVGVRVANHPLATELARFASAVRAFFLRNA